MGFELFSYSANQFRVFGLGKFFKTLMIDLAQVLRWLFNWPVPVQVWVALLPVPLLRQLGLRRAGIGFPLLDPRYARPYAMLVAGTVCMAAVLFTTSNPVGLVSTAIVAAAAMLISTRDALQIRDVFPGLARLPLVRAFVT